LRAALEVGDHEAWVVLGLAAGVHGDLGLDDDPALALPGLGGVTALLAFRTRIVHSEIVFG